LGEVCKRKFDYFTGIDEMTPPLVSVIVSTKNEEKLLPCLLASIRKQTYKNTEIVLVDNNSTDKTKEIASKFTKKIFNFGPERSAQRNYGASKAAGSYLLFVDADMELSPGVVEDCVGMTQTAEVGGVIIPEVSFGIGFWAQVKAFERSFYVGDDSVESARFYRKSIFTQVGGFDEKLLGFEDLELSNRVRAKALIVRIASVIRHNEKRPTLLGMAKKSAYYARGTDRLLAKWKVSPINPRTFYFLRSAYWKNWRKLVSHPLLSIAMFVMLTTQLCFGAVSYLKGRGK